jgi:hypothetical protein
MKKIIVFLFICFSIFMCCSCQKKVTANILRNNNVEFLQIKKMLPGGTGINDYEVSTLCIKGYYFVVAKSDRGISITQIGTNGTVENRYMRCGR